jgi:hypothetical protein
MSTSFVGVEVEIGAGRIDRAYASWLSAESECAERLRRWQHGERGGAAAAYVGYRAALEREEAAARELQTLCERAAARDERVVDGRKGVWRRLN